MSDLQEKFNLAYLFISHDLSVVEHISNTIGVMYLGSLVESGDKESIFSHPCHPYTQALFSAIPVPDPTHKMQKIPLEGSIPSPQILPPDVNSIQDAVTAWINAKGNPKDI